MVAEFEMATKTMKLSLKSRFFRFVAIIFINFLRLDAWLGKKAKQVEKTKRTSPNNLLTAQKSFLIKIFREIGLRLET